MKADRLYAITLYLLNHKRASGRCLADTFEVSLRCIQRDMDTLSMAGVPIIAYSGVNGGYELQEGYKLPVALVKDCLLYTSSIAIVFYCALNASSSSRASSIFRELNFSISFSTVSCFFSSFGISIIISPL